MSDFAEIFAKWEREHDEEKAMAGKRRQGSAPKESALTVNEIRKLKVQDELDLHNVHLDDAVKATREFLDASFEKGLRKVRIITGKGIHSPNGESIIRPSVISEVNRHPGVTSCDMHPKAADGGSGALIIVLKNNPKIRMPSCRS